MSDVSTGTAMTSTTTATASDVDRPPRRLKRPMMIAAGLAVAVVVAGVPLTVSAVERAAVTAAAQADAAALLTAADEAREAAGERDATFAAASGYLEAVAVSASENVAANPGEYTPEAVDALTAAVAGLSALVTDPADASQIAPALDAVDVAPDRLVAELTRSYGELDGDRREAARDEVAAEAARLDSVAADARDSVVVVQGAVDAVDAALVGAAAAGSATGASTLAALEYATEETRAALQESIDRLAAVAATELPLAWDERVDGEAHVLAPTSEALVGYSGAAATARTSHQDNAPRPATPIGTLRQCFISTFGGGGYLGWCSN